MTRLAPGTTCPHNTKNQPEHSGRQAIDASVIKTTCSQQNGWLSRRYWLSAELGLFGGPLAYYAGEEAGAVHFLPPCFLHLVVLEVVWSLVLPAIDWISDRLTSRLRSVAATPGRRERAESC